MFEDKNDINKRNHIDGNLNMYTMWGSGQAETEIRLMIDIQIATCLFIL